MHRLLHRPWLARRAEVSIVSLQGMFRMRSDMQITRLVVLFHELRKLSLMVLMHLLVPVK